MVVVNGVSSEPGIVTCGVPQGSILGPLLFLVYINDLEQDIKSRIKFYAVDTMLYLIVKDPSLSAEELNYDLDIIHQLAHQWKMKFNPDPTKQANEIVFSCKRSKPNHPPLSLNDNQVVQVDKQKHLGLILCPNLCFQKDINEKLTKARKMTGLI